VHSLHTETTFENADLQPKHVPLHLPGKKNLKSQSPSTFTNKVHAESTFENFSQDLPLFIIFIFYFLFYFYFCLHLPRSLSLFLSYLYRTLLPKFRDFHLLLCLILKINKKIEKYVSRAMLVARGETKKKCGISTFSRA